MPEIPWVLIGHPSSLEHSLARAGFLYPYLSNSSYKYRSCRMTNHPFEHLGLRGAKGALRPKPLFEHLGLRVAKGALRPKPLFEPHRTILRLEIAVDTRSVDVVICPCSSWEEFLRLRSFSPGNVMRAIVKELFEVSRNPENMRQGARG